jgi:hypothetical protein
VGRGNPHFVTLIYVPVNDNDVIDLNPQSLAYKEPSLYPENNWQHTCIAPR